MILVFYLLHPERISDYQRKFKAYFLLHFGGHSLILKFTHSLTSYGIQKCTVV